MHSRYSESPSLRSYLLPLDMWNVINFGRTKYNIWKIVIEHRAALAHTHIMHIYNLQAISVCVEKSSRASRPFNQLQEL